MNADLTNRFSVFFLILVTVAFLVVLLPFWKAIFWAIVFSILFWPFSTYLTRNSKFSRSIAATLIILLIVLFILVPSLLLAGLIAEGAALLVDNAKAGIESGAFQPLTALATLEERFPAFFSTLTSFGVDLPSIKNELQDIILQFGQFVLNNILGFGQGAAAFAFQLFLMLYVTFTLLCIGDQVFKTLLDSFPLALHQKLTFSRTFASMATATLKGTAAVGIVQGILGGLIFWFLDIDSAIFWGSIMGLLSVVPPFGAGFVWAPAGLILALQGNLTSGIILIAYGIFIISMSDNVVRPIIVGRASALPNYLVLLSTIGGLILFGITGLVLGPVIAALFISAWQLQNNDGRRQMNSNSSLID